MWSLDKVNSFRIQKKYLTRKAKRKTKNGLPTNLFFVFKIFTFIYFPNTPKNIPATAMIPTTTKKAITPNITQPVAASVSSSLNSYAILNI